MLFNDLLKLEATKEKRGSLRPAQLRIPAVLSEIAENERRLALFRRMCILSCFNLIEAFINGIAWEFVQRHDISVFSNSDRRMLEEAEGSIIKRIIRIPQLVSGRPSSLIERQPPLSEFIDIIKPFRDSIVHASPFTVPEKFGGYDKLQKIYELQSDTVVQCVDVTERIIMTVHGSITGVNGGPSWYIQRNSKGGYKL